MLVELTPLQGGVNGKPFKAKVETSTLAALGPSRLARWGQACCRRGTKRGGKAWQENPSLGKQEKDPGIA